NASSVAVLWFGAGRIDAGAIEVGTLTAFITYLMQILMSVMMATFMFVMIPRAAVSAERIGDVLAVEPGIHFPEKTALTTAPAQGSGAVVEFDNVTFSYPGADDPVLHHLTFTANAGEMTAVIGSTGSGKTTLLNLIPRLFDVTSGVVRVN